MAAYTHTVSVSNQWLKDETPNEYFITSCSVSSEERVVQDFFTDRSNECEQELLCECINKGDFCQGVCYQFRKELYLKLKN